MFLVKLLFNPLIFLGGSVKKFLLLFVKLFIFIFLAKGRARVRLVLLVVFFAAFLSANLDYPKYWNQTADWVNPKLDAVDAPEFMERYDKWGVFRALDEKIYMKHFFDVAFSLGLDLQGGIHLVYEADLSDIASADRGEAMEALRDVIERRVNFLGVAEPVVQTQKSGDSSRLIIELAGISDPNDAIEAIGQTPFLEFKEARPVSEQIEIVLAFSPDLTESEAGQFCLQPDASGIAIIAQITGKDPCFITTGLTGKYLDSAGVTSDPTTGVLQISLQFDNEGAKLFEEITQRNVGAFVAIYLDEFPISIPRVNSVISGGQAVITGSFNPNEARALARNLNAGALPVPISIISQQRIGASLGAESVNASLKAGIIGVLSVLAFLILIYRFSGAMAVISLVIYISFLLAFIKLIPITMTLAGIAGLILSIGMAVDANILVFERLREELKEGTDNLSRAVDKAFSRAWPSIRDGNISTLLTAAILFWFSTSFVKGFALTLGIGILISLFSSMIVTKYLMKLFVGGKLAKFKFIWSR